MATSFSSLSLDQKRNADEATCLVKNKGRSIWEGLKVAAPILAGGFAAFLSLAIFDNRALQSLAGGASIICLLSAGWVLRFFRDFQPVPPISIDEVVSPAHGVVDSIETNAASNFLRNPCTRISIYLSLKDVHVQYAPIRGLVVHCEHIPGKRQRAIHQRASMENEHLVIVIEAAERADTSVVVRLIAGIWVRRIIPWFARGDLVGRSERLGLIRFGSRVDVYLPAECGLTVRVGDRVIGGQTALARLKAI